MNSENAPKEILKSFTENMEKGLMNENQQPSVQQELKRGEEKGGESRELHRVGAGESSASATTDIILVLQHRLLQRNIAEVWGSKTCGDSQ